MLCCDETAALGVAACTGWSGLKPIKASIAVPSSTLGALNVAWTDMRISGT